MGCCQSKKENCLYRLTDDQIDVIKKYNPEFSNVLFLLLHPIYFHINGNKSYIIDTGFAIHGGHYNNDCMNIIHDFTYHTHFLTKEFADSIIKCDDAYICDDDDWNYFNRIGALYISKDLDSNSILVMKVNIIDKKGKFYTNKFVKIIDKKEVELFDDFFKQSNGIKKESDNECNKKHLLKILSVSYIE